MKLKERIDVHRYIEEAMENLKYSYPDGLLGYYYPDGRTLAQVTCTLQERLPSVLVFPISDLSPGGNDFFAHSQQCIWPADIGTQMGDTFYGVSSWMERILYPGLDEKILHPDFIFEDEVDHLRKYFPRTFEDIRHDQPMAIEGGCLVPVGGSQSAVYVPQLFMDYGEVEYAFDQEGAEMLEAPCVYDWRPSLYQAMTRLSIDHPDDWTYANRHIDVLLTGVYDQRSRANSFFVDNTLWEFLDEQESMTGMQWIPEWLRDAHRVSHESVLQGGLNISYVDTEDGTTAVCADTSTMDPRLLETIGSQGIDICELGQDQVMHKGGPKCRSMRLYWNE